MKLFVTLMFLVGAVIGDCATSDTSIRSFKKGMYVLSSGTKPLSSDVYSNADVAGVSLRANWTDIEPVEGQYNWSFFDSEIANANQAGKKVMLRVTAGINTPSWVLAKGVQLFSFTDQDGSFKTPVPWDAIWQSEWAKFVKAFGAKYDHTPSVVLIQMGVPNKHGGEMHLPDTSVDKTNWLSIGYTKDKLVGAYLNVVKAYSAAFSKKPLAIDATTPLWDDGTLQDTLSGAYNLLGNRFYVQHNALAAKTSSSWIVEEQVASYASKTTIGFQMLCAASGDPSRFGGSMQEALDLGLKAGASYFEIYYPDLRDTQAAQAIHTTALILKNK